MEACSRVHLRALEAWDPYSRRSVPARQYAKWHVRTENCTLGLFSADWLFLFKLHIILPQKANKKKNLFLHGPVSTKPREDQYSFSFFFFLCVLKVRTSRDHMFPSCTQIKCFQRLDSRAQQMKNRNEAYSTGQMCCKIFQTEIWCVFILYMFETQC